MSVEQLPSVDALLANPAVLLALAAVIVLVYHYVNEMPYSEFVLLTQIKHRAFLILSPFARRKGLRLVTTKQYREDDEYLATVSLGPKELASKFKDAGLDYHVIAGSKRRETPEGRQWAHSHYAYQHEDGTQTEVWLYTNPKSSTDIYAHQEESVFDPEGHLSEPFTPGDPRGVLDGVIQR